MSTTELLVHSESGEFRLPSAVHDYESFRKWAREDRPEKSRVGYYAGLIWADLSMEQLYSHGAAKGAIFAALFSLFDGSKGRVMPDGSQVSIPSVELTTIPDAIFVSYSSFESGRVQEIGGAQTGYVELEGPPDMILEVVSDSSVHKDTEMLPEVYAHGGVTEFWRVDARKEEVVFEILRLEGDRYIEIEPNQGWLYSSIFEQHFRLLRNTDGRGRPVFSLAHRD